MLWLEISNFFTCIRWLMFFYGVAGGDWKHTLNSIFGAIAFLFGRTLTLIYVAIFIVLPWYTNVFNYDKLTEFENIFNSELLFVVCFNICLNLYWSMLIIKQIGRIV